MTGFFVVKGELAAWALGLEEDEVVPAEDAVLLRAPLEEEPHRRRKRRLGHEDYRQLVPRRRELIDR